MKILHYFSILSLLIAGAVGSAVAAEDADNEALIDEIIQRARASVGSEADLKAVKSITFKGSILYGNGSTGTIELAYKKPYFHRLKSVIDNALEISGLDDTEGWIKSAPAATPENWNLVILEADQVYNMRAKVSESLNFYARPTGRSSRVTYEGEHDIEGRTCHALLYYHGSGVWNLNYFDKETGSFAKTVNSKGIEFFERGEMMIDGIRFPKKLISVIHSEQGRGTMEISLNSIVLNKQYSDDVFKMPSLVD